LTSNEFGIDNTLPKLFGASLIVNLFFAMGELQFIQALHKGDTEALKYLYDLYYTAVCHLIAKFLADYNEPPHDIATDAFLVVWNNRTNFHSLNHTKSYLFVVAVNNCKQIIKREKRKRLFVTGYSLVTESNHNPCSPKFDKQKALTKVEESIEHLNSQDRKVVELYYICEMELASIAMLLNLNTELIKKRKQRAVDKLRERINCNEFN